MRLLSTMPIGFHFFCGFDSAHMESISSTVRSTRICPPFGLIEIALHDRAVAAPASGPLRGQIRERSAADQLNDEGLSRPAAGLHLNPVVDEQLERVGADDRIADAQHVDLGCHGGLRVGLLLFVPLNHFRMPAVSHLGRILLGDRRFHLGVFRVGHEPHRQLERCDPVNQRHARMPVILDRLEILIHRISS